jgi:hypothetical protein
VAGGGLRTNIDIGFVGLIGYPNQARTPQEYDFDKNVLDSTRSIANLHHTIEHATNTKKYIYLYLFVSYIV